MSAAVAYGTRHYGDRRIRVRALSENMDSRMPPALFATLLRLVIRRLPRQHLLPYVPGFGGHRRRSSCRCSIADELICGRPHPDKRESYATVVRRQQAALVVSEREARISAWLAELAGTGAERDPSTTPKWKRPSEAEDKSGPTRNDRPLSDAEWREALAWMRRQPLRGPLREQRREIAAQAWLELRRPPLGCASLPFAKQVRRAWARAVVAIRKENETAWHLPAPDRDQPDEDQI